MKDNKILQNHFFLPLTLCIVQFCFLAVALYGSSFDFEKKILIVSFLLVGLWGVFFIVDFVQKKNFEINIFNALLIIVFLLLCFNLIRQSWFVNYLRIDAIQRFFEGKTFIDTLYHSAIAESIVTNGYPSIQQNAPIFLSYHCLSHYVVAGISKVLSVPCFVTYNYLFPIIIIPLLLFLFQRAATVGKSYFSGTNELSFIEFIILVGVCCGFVTRQQQLNLGCNFYVNIYNSESCLVALILLFLYFCLINKGYEKLKCFNNINLLVVIPVFIILLSFAKISFGIIFMLGASYYVFRRYLFHDKRWFLFIGYCGIFIIYYLIIKNNSNSYSAEGINIQNDFTLFSYVKAKCKNIFYIILHYLFLFFPIVSAIILTKVKVFKDILVYKKERLFLEMCFLLMLGACLPGIFLDIHGGSAFYFVIPVYVFSWILLVSYDVPAILIKKHVRAGQICFALLTILVVLSCGRNMKVLDSFHQTLRARVTSVQTMEDKEYISFNQIRKEIAQNSRDFCVFIPDDSEMISRFDKALKNTSPKVYNCRPYLAASAYLGLPVINSIYEKDNRFYRGDDKEYGQYNDFAGAYNMPPAICGKKVTESNMKEAAKAINRSHIIVLHDNNYSVLDLE